MNYYPQILGIIDLLNEWNEKLNDFAAGHMDNAAVGTAIMGILLFVAVWGIKELNRKQ